MSTPIQGLVVLRADELDAIVRAAVRTTLDEREPTAAPALLDREGCAQLLGISLGTLDRLRREGMPSLLVGDAARFEREAVLAWLRERGR